MPPRAAQMSEAATLARAGRPYAQTANCAVRAQAFAAVGGFDESARCGEDADLAFRLADAGWGLELRPRRRVRHLSRAPPSGGCSPSCRVTAPAPHGWHRRHPGEFAAPAGAALARRGAHRICGDALRGAARGDPRPR